MTQFRSEFTKYQASRHEEAGEKEAYVEQMFDQVSPTYDLLNRLMSGGMDKSWRGRLIRESELKAGGQILDLCTGTGDVLLEFGRQVPGCRGVGLDFSSKMLEVAQKKNIFPDFKFVRGSALDLPFEAGSFDVVSMS